MDGEPCKASQMRNRASSEPEPMSAMQGTRAVGHLFPFQSGSDRFGRYGNTFVTERLGAGAGLINGSGPGR
jgi:hypothetical protein